MTPRALFPRALVVTALAVAAVPGALAQTATSPNDVPREKLAQTTMKFLAVSTDPRAAALADAVTAVEGLDEAALFYNPASMARQTTVGTVGAAQTQWIFGIDHNAVGATFAPANGRYGVFGASLQYVDYGDDFIETIRSDNTSGYDELGTFRPTALSVGVGYAKPLSDRFSVGGQAKYVAMNIVDPVSSRGPDGSLVRASGSQSTVAYDLGMLYKTGYKSLNFAVSARNFSPNVTFVREGYQLPLALRIGVAMNLVDVLPLNPALHELNASVDALNSRDYPEQLKAGLEYGFMKTFFLRGGMATRGGEQGASVGFGVRRGFGGVGLGADYAYTDFGDLNAFGKVHRLGLRVAF